MKSEIKKYYFKAGLPQEFEIIDIADLYKKSGQTIVLPHRDNFYHVIWFQNSDVKHIVDFNPINSHIDSLLFIAKDCVHSFDDKSAYNGKVLLFTENFFCRDVKDLNFLHSTILYNDLFEISQVKLNPPTESLIDIFRLMESEFKTPTDKFQPIILKNLLHTFLLCAERERRKQNFKEIKPSVDLDYVLVFKDLIEKKYREFKLVNQYVSELSLTEKRLNKATSLILDKTPKQMIDERIILEAKRLLCYSNSSIKELSFDLGFDEPTNFIKYFRKHSNCTPSEFREKSL